MTIEVFLFAATSVVIVLGGLLVPVRRILEWRVSRETDSFAAGQELRLNMLGEGFVWSGGSNKPVELDQCAGYPDKLEH